MTRDGDLFDHYASGYEEELSKAISPSGESREYFAVGRVAWLRRSLRELNTAPQTVLDFGCGDGSSTPLLLEMLQVGSVIGVDVSEKSIELAERHRGTPKVRYQSLRSFRPSGLMDLAYCNGVFHHIRPQNRAGALAVVNESLRVGGFFSLWENNPWNPMTRYVMSRCAFDRDAQTLTPPETQALLRNGNFEILRTDFRFIFPRVLRLFRKIEDLVYRLPFGTQYHILARKNGPN